MQRRGQLLVLARNEIQSAGDTGVKTGRGRGRGRYPPRQGRLRINVRGPDTQAGYSGCLRGDLSPVAFGNPGSAPTRS
jgi:hypothetical protein